MKAAKKARCHKFIEKLPDGYNTLIGEGGASLSGGEKQRISIARAMLKDAPIVIFDEATANVDPENEDQLKTIRNANQILVLNNGKIEQRGTHEELMSKGGLYKISFKRKIKRQAGR